MNGDLGYEAGVERLLERLGKPDKMGNRDPHYEGVLILQQRLRENLQATHDYGDTENLRSERSRIIGELNSVTLNTLGVSFNDMLPVPSTNAGRKQTTAELSGTKESLPPIERLPANPIGLDRSHSQAQWEYLVDAALDVGGGVDLIVQKSDFTDYIKRCRVLIMPLPHRERLTDREITAVEHWVRVDGGGLLLLGYYAANIHHHSNPNSLARIFRFEFADNLIMPSDKTTDRDCHSQPYSNDSRFAVQIRLSGSDSHPIVANVREVAFLSSCSIITAAVPDLEFVIRAPHTSTALYPIGPVDKDGQMKIIERWDVMPSAQEPVLAACRYGKGRVILVGTWKIFTLRICDNAALIRNMLTWLAQ